jgi:hypothetical protein
MERMKPAPEPKPKPASPESTPFENFDRLFRAVVSVPKSAVEAEEAKERLKNQRERERKKVAKTKP